MKNLIKISEFSGLSGISRKLLIYYDKYGILKPKYVDPENGYRYYSRKQLESASVIVSLRQAGMSLASIKEYLNKKSPDHLMELLSMQEKQIEEQIRQLCNIKQMIESRKKLTERGKEARPNQIYIKYCPEETIFLGPRIEKKFDYESLWSGTIDFLEACRRYEIPIGLPINGITDISRRDYLQPEYYYCEVPFGKGEIFQRKEEGEYLIATAYAPYNAAAPVYDKIFQFIEKNALNTEQIAYEEYLTDELTEENDQKYLLQISIRIKK